MTQKPDYHESGPVVTGKFRHAHGSIVPMKNRTIDTTRITDEPVYFAVRHILLIAALLFPLHPAHAGQEKPISDLAQSSNTTDGLPTLPDSEADTVTEKSGKFLPLPIFVTEPAIGEGLGAALIYFHQEDDDSKRKVSTARELSKTGEHSKPPPTATGVFGFYTNNDTAALGVGHANSFADDHYRLRVAAVEARINSNYYIGDRAVDFQIEGSALFSDLKTRLGETGAFIGLSASYMDGNNVFREELQEIDGIDLEDFNFVDAGMALSLIYDTRDNTILPARGFLLEYIRWQYDESLGGDFNYNSSRLKALWFSEITDKTVLGLRVDAGDARGDLPFFAEPYVRLRGIPALRYQGEVAGAFEVEGRYRLADRWTDFAVRRCRICQGQRRTNGNA